MYSCILFLIISYHNLKIYMAICHFLYSIHCLLTFFVVPYKIKLDKKLIYFELYVFILNTLFGYFIILLFIFHTLRNVIFSYRRKQTFGFLLNYFASLIKTKSGSDFSILQH